VLVCAFAGAAIGTPLVATSAPAIVMLRIRLMEFVLLFRL
jgi:hypothetical protein